MLTGILNILLMLGELSLVVWIIRTIYKTDGLTKYKIDEEDD